jgi:hypothetical protein
MLSAADCMPDAMPVNASRCCGVRVHPDKPKIKLRNKVVFINYFVNKFRIGNKVLLVSRGLSSCGF